VDAPDRIEAELPHLTLFGSAYSSARGDAGICRTFDRFMDPVPARNCDAFEHRREADAQDPVQGPFR
jgi:hypothetical protein